MEMMQFLYLTDETSKSLTYFLLTFNLFILQG